jgi:predicted transcriptional regulator
MNSKITRKRRTDRNHAIYVITNILTDEQYVGITAVTYGGNVNRTLNRRMQKHMQRAQAENKNWGLSKNLREFGAEAFTFGLLEVVRGKRSAHSRETILINTIQPAMNTFGVK